MRMSRWEWLAKFFRPAKRASPVRPKREDRASKRTWIILGQRFQAFTKSEARAQAKAAFGYKGRLPVGTAVVEERSDHVGD